MVTKEQLINEERERLRELRRRYETIVNALASGQVASQEARELLYERMIALEEEMFAVEDRIDALMNGEEVI